MTPATVTMGVWQLVACYVLLMQILQAVTPELALGTFQGWPPASWPIVVFYPWDTPCHTRLLPPVAADSPLL
jgi:hypothetical protein